MNNIKTKVAIVGTNGIPAKYGGYETLAENLTKHLSEEFDFIVYCSINQPKLFTEYNNSRLKFVFLKANGWQSIFYDIFTLFHAALTVDVILYLGPGAGFIVPFLKMFKTNIIVNHGGLNEWEREKYSWFQKYIARLGHKYAAQYSTYNITDNSLLRQSIKEEFGVDSQIIRYGGDHTQKENVDNQLLIKYPFLETNYFVNVSRAQVDNNLHLVLRTFKNHPMHKLVMISNWSVSSYGVELEREYKGAYQNITILSAIYNPKEINAIRSNAMAYIHSHSYCGTSPSLVEAMSLGLPAICFDVPTNRETTKNKALYFKNADDLSDVIFSMKKTDYSTYGLEMKNIANAEYSWQRISSKYADIFRKMTY